MLYLRQNLLAEPLVGQWYAWSYLIAPATAALYIANVHLKVMRSFVATPQIHVAASRNPALIGGPYIHYGEERRADIAELIDQTMEQQDILLQLADALTQLEALLSEKGDGYSLEGLYAHVPPVLRGYVELIYDLRNQPSVRLIEALFYSSHFYQPEQQSFLLSLIEQDARPFVLNSPRLQEPYTLSIKLPFAHSAVDALFQMRQTPQPLEWIAQQLGIAENQLDLFASFFTPEPSPLQNSPTNGVRIRYFGHACILIESRDVAILVDPLISHPYKTELPRFTYADLPERIDYVLITHNHQDHCIFETLLPLRYRISTVVVPKNNGGSLADPSLKLILKHCGFKQVIELDEMETLDIPEGAITGLPFLGEHADLNIRTKLAYHVALRGHTILLIADSNNLEHKLYEHLQRLLGKLDILFIGMECDGAPLSWLYGALLSKPLTRRVDQSRRLNGSDCQKAAAIIDLLKPEAVYVYAMGQEPWLSHLTAIQYTETSRPLVESEKLVSLCREKGLHSERLFGCREFVI